MSKETPSQKVLRMSKDKQVKADSISKETPEENSTRTLKNKQSMANSRSMETPEEYSARIFKSKQVMSESRKQAPVSFYAAKSAQDVFKGDQIVKELKHTDEAIGSMSIECSECSALKWKGESSTRI